MNKHYLGDAVSVEIDDLDHNILRLTAGTNEIFLDRSVVGNLLEYIHRFKTGQLIDPRYTKND